MPSTALWQCVSYDTFCQHFAGPCWRHGLPGVNTPRTSGADLARLVTDPALDNVTGQYFIRRSPARSSAASYDKAIARALHDDSRALLAEAEADVPK